MKAKTNLFLILSPHVHFGSRSLTARIPAAQLTARSRKLSELTSAVRRARAMPLCGNLYLGNTLRALAGDVTLRWEVATAGCRSREIGDLILVKIEILLFSS